MTYAMLHTTISRRRMYKTDVSNDKRYLIKTGTVNQNATVQVTTNQEE